MRYRLRFHLQEIDLVGEEIVVGRGSGCQVTIDDPMLSRRHVRIDLGASGPAVEDLRSRNGTQLNGSPLTRRAPLRDGDRIRIGTRELVFLVPQTTRKDFRTTSGLVFCVGCAVPYPSISAQCPHCGAVRTEQGHPAQERGVASGGWTFYLLSQVVERAIEQGRLADAERMMSRGVAELDEQAEVDPGRVHSVAESVARLGCALGASHWLEVAVRLYDRAGAPPSQGVLDLIEALPPDARLADASEALRQSGSGTLRAS